MPEKGARWTREELLLALNLYHRIPFSKYDQRTPEVIDLAALVGRTPSAIAYKLSNFAALDDNITQRGFSNYSKADEAIWIEFRARSVDLVVEAEEVRGRLGLDSLLPEAQASVPVGVEGVERETLVKVRVNQHTFGA